MSPELRVLLWRDGKALIVSRSALSVAAVERIRAGWESWRSGERKTLVIQDAEIEFVEVEPGALSIAQGEEAP